VKPGLLDRMLSCVVSTAYAQTLLNTLPGFTVTVYDGYGHVVATGVTDPTGTVVFPALPPGNYGFVVSNPSYPNTVLLLLATLTNQSVILTANANSTAAAVVALSEVPNGNFSGMDVDTYNSLATGNADYQAVAASIANSLASGSDFFDPSQRTITDPQLEAEVQTAANSALTVIQRYPAPYQTGIATTNVPVYVTFSKAMNTATMPPAYTNWQVIHYSQRSGQTVTIDNSNFPAFGSWSYTGETPNTVIGGINVPAHSLVFTYTGTMASNAQEDFQWKFGTMPNAADGMLLTSSTTQPGQVNNLTFYTK